MSKTILNVEDDVFLQDLEKQKLTEAGYTLLCALNGKDAVDILDSKQKIDLILLDIMLPDMDGFEILKKIRASETYKNTPVIVFSNLSEKKDMEHGTQLGASVFMTKPNFTLDDLVNKIKEFIG